MAIVGAISDLLQLERPDPVPRPACVTRAEWATQALEDLPPTLQPLVEMWYRDAANGLSDGTAGSEFWEAFGPLTGMILADLASRSLGDFEIPLPRLARRKVVALPVGNLVAFASDWRLPVQTVVRWSFACSIVQMLLMRSDVLGARVSRLAVRYRWDIKTYPNAAFERVLLGGLADGLVDMNGLVGARSSLQLTIATKLATMSALIDSIGKLAWRSVDPSYTYPLERSLVEALRRRRAAVSRPQSVAEFWMGVPIGSAPSTEADEFVRVLSESPGGLPLLWSGRRLPTAEDLTHPREWIQGAAPPASTSTRGPNLVVAGDSPIPGRPRIAEIRPDRRIRRSPAGPDLSRLEEKLRSALSKASDAAVQEALRGRIDGLQTDAEERKVARIPAGATGYRVGFLTGWLQLELLEYGAAYDAAIERVSALYAFVIGARTNESLLQTDDSTDLLRLHTQAMIQIERRQMNVEPDMEKGLFAWLVALTPLRLTPGLMATCTRMREHRHRLDEGPASRAGNGDASAERLSG